MPDDEKDQGGHEDENQPYDDPPPAEPDWLRESENDEEKR